MKANFDKACSDKAGTTCFYAHPETAGDYDFRFHIAAPRLLCPQPTGNVELRIL